MGAGGFLWRNSGPAKLMRRHSTRPLLRTREGEVKQREGSIALRETAHSRRRYEAT
jgi:hypothetical protein